MENSYKDKVQHAINNDVPVRDISGAHGQKKEAKHEIENG